MNATEVCLTRHGETDWNKQGILQGWSDVPLNSHGRQQALAMVQRYGAAGFAAVWSSPLVRAYETAQIISAALNLPAPTLHHGLKERHFGAIQGIPKEELAELNPAQLAQILRRNPAAQFVGGESMDDFAERVLHAMREIGCKHQGQRVLVISHGWVLDVVLRHIRGLPRHAVLPVKPKNGESVYLQVDGTDILASTSVAGEPT